MIVGAILLTSKFYYPPLPIQQMSKKEVVEKGHRSNGQLLKLSTEKNYDWYIIEEENMETTDEAIKAFVNRYGWNYFQKEGSGLFFKKHGEMLIITTEKWTRDYTLIKMPVKFNK
ncbi:hypothetical protein [Bacillus sp. FJAT-27245]|uniref:hypothetical protein n=1 Tax=Bacillus sp. FJAT-27245 TaxID=1684144 RepID=UPI0006A7D4FC|nr:hypothetical protein [Bacillus sp. FJAT-27245]